MFGYKKSSVDLFLQELSDDYENVLKELEALKSDNKSMKEQLSQFQRIEETLHKALITAENTAEDVVKHAQIKSEDIIEQADHKAIKIIEQANHEILRLHKEQETIKKEIDLYKTKMRVLLEEQLSLLK